MVIILWANLVKNRPITVMIDGVTEWTRKIFNSTYIFYFIKSSILKKIQTIDYFILAQRKKKRRTLLFTEKKLLSTIQVLMCFNIVIKYLSICNTSIRCWLYTLHIFS